MEILDAEAHNNDKNLSTQLAVGNDQHWEVRRVEQQSLRELFIPFLQSYESSPHANNQIISQLL